MKKRVKRLIKINMFLAFAFFITITSILNVNAFNEYDGYICDHGYHTFGDRQMGYGVGDYGNNRRYYYATGFDDFHMNLIEKAVSEWVNTSNEGPHVKTSISIRKTTNKKSALFELENDRLPPFVLGQTKWYLNQEEVVLLGDGSLPKNYGWAKCLISVSAMESELVVSDNRKGTIAHELGHAMGLSHQNYRSESIMCQLGNYRTATRADAHDCETINHIYG